MSSHIAAISLLFMSLASVNLELFTSTSSFETFLHFELNATITTLEKYLNCESGKRDLNFKKDLKIYKNSVISGLRMGIDNPVGFYLVTKNISLHWNVLNKFASKNLDLLNVFVKVHKNRREYNITVPDEHDLRMCLIGLVRLQDVYKLKVKDIITGNFTGTPKIEASLDANDCLKLGLVFLEFSHYADSLLWLEEALNKLKQETNKPSVNELEILRHYSYTLYKEGRLKDAKKALADFFRLADKERFYAHLNSFDLFPQENEIFLKKFNEKTPLKIFMDVYNCSESYKTLCAARQTKDVAEIPSALNCFYKMDRPFLKLAPLKVEILSVDPEAYSFKNVISDEEIGAIKNLTEPKLVRAKVDEGVATDYRISKFAWLLNNESDILSVLNRRMEDMTNLNSDYAEALQVVNYGIGGYYDLHFDSFGMSTPGAGGSTVFPLANIAAIAQKNDAIMWYNLHRNGTRHGLTLHAGCPVLSGKKWIANKWFHEYGQEFIRKCTLNKHE